MKFTQWFGNHSEEAVQSFIEQAPGTPYLNEFNERLGMIIGAERAMSRDFDNVKAVEVTITDFYDKEETDNENTNG